MRSPFRIFCMATKFPLLNSVFGIWLKRRLTNRNMFEKDVCLMYTVKTDNHRIFW